MPRSARPSPTPHAAPSAAPPAPRPPRAFALPLVLMLALVGGLAAVLLLSRHGTSHRAVARQIDSYRDHHRSAGIKECILRWVSTARSRVDESVDADGHAFTMNIRGEGGSIGGSVRVSLVDAQGALLSETSTISGHRREIVEAAKFLIESVPPEARGPEPLFRVAGPAEISINTAPELVVRAVCLAIVDDPAKAAAAAEAVLRERDRVGVAPVPLGPDGRPLPDDARPLSADPTARFAPGDVMKALAGVPITDQQRRDIAGMFVAKTTLYRCVAETRDASGNLLDRSAGLYFMEEGRADAFVQGGAFLTWESLALDPSER